MANQPMPPEMTREALRALADKLATDRNWAGSVVDELRDLADRLTPSPAQADPAANTLEWSATLCDGERVNHAAAEKACAALGEGWRLPTRAELLTLVDDTRHDPAIDTSRFPDTQSGAYWTSTPCAWAPSYAWFVLFNYGYADYFHRDNLSAFVRAVRSVPAVARARTKESRHE